MHWLRKQNARISWLSIWCELQTAKYCKTQLEVHFLNHQLHCNRLQSGLSDKAQAGSEGHIGGPTSPGIKHAGYMSTGKTCCCTDDQAAPSGPPCLNFYALKLISSTWQSLRPRRLRGEQHTAPLVITAGQASR